MDAQQLRSYRVAGLFAGIGGLESGLHSAGHSTVMLCEIWPAARAVLTQRFPAVSVEDDVRELESLPESIDVVVAGFPCQDLSQAGRTAGISGEQSGLVSHVFRLIDRKHPRWLVLENVRNMLPLDGGRAMHHLVTELEERRYAGRTASLIHVSPEFRSGVSEFCWWQAGPMIREVCC